MMHTRTHHPRGITLLISVILTAVVLSVALALLEVSYKQVLLTATAKQSQTAIYNADSVLECALYWDQKQDAFNYTASPLLTSGFTCNDGRLVEPLVAPNSSTQNGVTGIRTTVFKVPCPSPLTGVQGAVTIFKKNTGATTIFATGYSTCTETDPRRIERGLTVTYGSS